MSEPEQTWRKEHETHGDALTYEPTRIRCRCGAVFQLATAGDCGDPSCGCATRAPWPDDLGRKCSGCGKTRDDVRWGKCAECREAVTP